MTLPKKFPTIAGLLIAILLVGSVVAVSEHAIRLPLRASQSTQPERVQITNISDSTFTVTWHTDSAATGAIRISKPNSSDRVYYDERDASGKLNAYTEHSVPVKDLSANTKYQVTILSNGTEFANQPGSDTQTGAQLPPNASAMEPAYGTVLLGPSNQAAGALVMLTFDGGQILSALTKTNGLWLIPLAQVRTNDLSGFLAITDRLTETIQISLGEKHAEVKTDPMNDAPVPDVTLGQSYDFRGQQVKKITGNTIALRATPTTEAQQPIGGAVLAATTQTTHTVSLATPTEGANITATLPLISGTGIPNTFVGITIGINAIQSGSTKVLPDGTWHFTPTKALAPGKQSVSISTVDQKGKAIALTHAFTILKSGTQVLGDATPSATLTQTMTPTTSPIPSISQSATTTATPTQIVTQPPEESTLAGQEIPVTGNQLPTLVLLFVGFGLMSSGLLALRR